MTPTPATAHLDGDHRFLGTRRTGEGEWEVPVTAALLTPAGGLYGGAGIAIAAAALESATGRPLRWITAQFAGTATDGEVLSVHVEAEAVGRRVTQARARAAVASRTVVHAVAALGEDRTEAATGTWVEMPRVPAPAESSELSFPMPTEGTFFARTERRFALGPAPGDLGSGWVDGPQPQLAVWSRIVDHVSTTPAMLGWLADMVPMGVGAALGRAMGGTSLDNTLRIVEPATADWVLVDIRAIGASAGYGHGAVHLWAPDGTLLATGAQTAVLRAFPGRMPGEEGGEGAGA